MDITLTVPISAFVGARAFELRGSFFIFFFFPFLYFFLPNGLCFAAMYNRLRY